MFLPVGPLARPELGKMSGLHFQHVVNRVGPVTEAELEAQMAEAALIHAREWSATPHPLDAQMPVEVHDWAVRHIAANLVARARGYDAARMGYRQHAAPQREVELTPAARTGDWMDRP